MTDRLEELRYKWATTTTQQFTKDEFNELVILLLQDNDKLLRTLEEISQDVNEQKQSLEVYN